MDEQRFPRRMSSHYEPEQRMKQAQKLQKWVMQKAVRY